MTWNVKISLFSAAHNTQTVHPRSRTKLTYKRHIFGMLASPEMICT